MCIYIYKSISDHPIYNQDLNPLNPSTKLGDPLGKTSQSKVSYCKSSLKGKTSQEVKSRPIQWETFFFWWVDLNQKQHCVTRSRTFALGAKRQGQGAPGEAKGQPVWRQQEAACSQIGISQFRHPSHALIECHDYSFSNRARPCIAESEGKLSFWQILSPAWRPSL